MKTTIHTGWMLAGAMLLLAIPAKAETGCTVVADLASAEILHESGDCKTRYGAQSTFKIPLAVMGFDSHILKDAHTPVWPYDPAYQSGREAERQATDPARWEKESVVWFSQKITRTLGKEKFRAYVEGFDYGNKDISGDAGKDNGLTHSWLSSSLKISPLEQIGFVRKLLQRDLPASKEAQDKTIEILPAFTAGDWKVHGKTGTGYSIKADGTLNKNAVQGWFVGWAQQGAQTIVFAKFVKEPPQEGSYAGPRARDAMLKELPVIMTNDQQNSH